MALNGLDSQSLKDAFDYAYSETGWFCMKYESRDEIVLLGKGASAIKEMRELMSREPDDSPIYGFIRYRRRNILVKVVPVGTSRVLKARSQVHFHSIVERFSPCDVTVSLKSARELTDAALTTACSTHTATASISSSSSSLRQRRLTDIQEASEEGSDNRPVETKTESKIVGNQQGLQVIVTTHDPGVGSDGTRAPIEVEISAPEPIKVEAEEADDISAGDRSEGGGRSRSGSFSRERTSDEFARKSTSSGSRPSAGDIYSDYSKVPAKVKLGPRPSPDWNKRPHTSATTQLRSLSPNGNGSRPIASIPKSVHLPHRKTRGGSGGGSSTSKLQFHESASSVGSSSVNPVLLPLQSAGGGNPNSHPSTPLSPTPSFKSFRSTSSSTISTLFPTITAPAVTVSAGTGISPEKARLMKALELRKKAMSQKVQQNQTKTEESIPTERESSTSVTLVEQLKPDNSIDASIAEPIPPSASSSLSDKQAMDAPVPDTPTQDSYTFSPEPPSEPTLPSPTAAPSTSTEHDSYRSFSDDLDRESESSYEPSDVNGESLESDTITEDENQAFRNLHPPPTLLLPTPKTNAILSSEEKSRLSLSLPTLLDPQTDNTSDAPLPSPQPPRSPLLHMNMLSPASTSYSPYTDTQQKLPKSHNRMPSTEVPVIETARSVSAPFTSTTIVEKKPVLVSSRKLNVSSGSVSQRIKQLELLAKSKQPAPAQSLSPSRSRPASPTPQFPIVRTNSLKTSASSPNLSPKIASGATTPQRLDSPFLIKKGDEEKGLNGKSYGLPLPGSPGTKSRAGSIGEIVLTPSRKSSTSQLALSTVMEPSVEERKESTSANSSEPTSPVTEKKSRLPPLLRRISSSKSKKSPTPSIPTSPERPAPPILAPSRPLELETKSLLTGWVNVQLPDTMLWKRRYLKINSDGLLYLSISEDETSQQTGKYNIKTEIRSATIPDIDEQELPNSVNLNLVEGGVLACACQNGREQTEIFKVIRSCIA